MRVGGRRPLRPLLWLAGGLLTACALADLLGRMIGVGALAQGERTAPRVALSFDDGPGERTGALLELLDRHGVQATFFVTWEACAAHPDLLRQLLDSPHQVEAHGVWHRHALRLWPWQEWAQLRWHPRADGRLYRPPYGGHSPLTRLLAGLGRRQIALWDVESCDWLARDPADLARQTLAGVQNGSVILLHDGPARTLPLLDALIPALRQRGHVLVRMDELKLRPLGVRAGLTRARQLFFSRAPH